MMLALTLDPTELIHHWGYSAIFVILLLGNVGVPVPEETVLLVGGYLIWRRQLRLPLVLAIGIVGAVIGDNIGYWLGRQYGRPVIDRYGRWLLLTSERLEPMERFVKRHGPLAVFVARFLPGFRFVAGPLAGIAGLPFRRFFPANLLGAVTYVPIAVAVGYAVGYELGDQVERLRGLVGDLERLVLAVAVIASVLLWVWRATHQPPPGERGSK